jgi:predicted phage terminase large subunit-like protein
VKVPSRVEVDREHVRRGGLLAFVRLAWPHVEPSVPLIEGWHVPLICQHLELVSSGAIDRLLINVPPGTGKSLLVSVMWPAWDWIEHPWRRFMASSHDDSLAGRDARKFRALVGSEWFRDRWASGLSPSTPGVTLDTGGREHADTVGTMWTTMGGLRFSSTVGGRAVGWHAHIQICDDPHRPLDLAPGPHALERVWTWWSETMSSRLVPTGHTARVIIMQRLADGDLSDRCLERGGWHHVCLPMHYDPEHPHRDPDDPRTVPGELLCPELKDETRVASEARELGPVGAAAQLEQRPTPPGGAVFLRKWEHRWAELSTAGGLLVQSWDLTFGEAADPGASWVVGQTWMARDADVYLLDQVRRRVSYPDMRALVAMFADRWPRATIRAVECAAAGRPLVEDLAHIVPGLVLVPPGPQGSKLARALAVTGMWAAGNVHVPVAEGAILDGRVHPAPWAIDFLSRVYRFRGLESDVADEVDAMSQALSLLAGKAAGGMLQALQARIRQRHAGRPNGTQKI